jgi:negative regulator of replication initiation
MPTIRIDDEVYGWLQSQARPFEDTPNTVLRRIAHLGILSVQMPATQKKVSPQPRIIGQGVKTPQSAFREPILKILQKHGGKADRIKVLKELENIMIEKLTEFDKSDISSGTVRWQKSAEWEVRVMREQGLLKQVHEEPRGVWALTKKI